MDKPCSHNTLSSLQTISNHFKPAGNQVSADLNSLQNRTEQFNRKKSSCEISQYTSLLPLNHFKELSGNKDITNDICCAHCLHGLKNRVVDILDKAMRKPILENFGYNLREPGNGERLKYLMKYVRDDRARISYLLNFIQIYKLFTELCLILLVDNRKLHSKVSARMIGNYFLKIY